MNRSLIALVLSSLIASAAVAQLNRSFVSTAGNDANPCTAPAPCRSFGAAIAVTNPGGEVLAIDSGGFGPFTLDRSVSVLAAPGVHAAVTATSGSAVLVLIGPTASASMSGLRLSGLGASVGIDFAEGRTLVVRECAVSGFSAGGIVLDRVSAGNTAELEIHGSTIENNPGNGILAQSIGEFSRVSLVVDGCSISGNRGGPGAGVNVRDSVIALVRNSTLVRNDVGVAVQADESNLLALATIDGCGIAFGTTGVGLGAGAFGSGAGASIVRLTHNTITANTNGVVISLGGAAHSFGTNRIEGNDTDLIGTLALIALE